MFCLIRNLFTFTVEPRCLRWARRVAEMVELGSQKNSWRTPVWENEKASGVSIEQVLESKLGRGAVRIVRVAMPPVGVHCWGLVPAVYRFGLRYHMPLVQFYLLRNEPWLGQNEARNPKTEQVITCCVFRALA
jgi:hypothetical protein